MANHWMRLLISRPRPSEKKSYRVLPAMPMISACMPASSSTRHSATSLERLQLRMTPLGITHSPRSLINRNTSSP